MIKCFTSTCLESSERRIATTCQIYFQKKEQELIQLRVKDIDEQDAYRITDFARRIRDLYKAEELSSSVSTRMCLSVAEFVVDGMDLIDALQQVCLPFYPIQAGDDTERVKVMQTIQSMGD